jgi:hypothetical protein
LFALLLSGLIGGPVLLIARDIYHKVIDK